MSQFNVFQHSIQQFGFQGFARANRAFIALLIHAQCVVSVRVDTERTNKIGPGGVLLFKLFYLISILSQGLIKHDIILLSPSLFSSSFPHAGPTDENWPTRCGIPFVCGLGKHVWSPVSRNQQVSEPRASRLGSRTGDG